MEKLGGDRTILKKEWQSPFSLWSQDQFLEAGVCVDLLMSIYSQYTPEGHLIHVKVATLFAQLLPLPMRASQSGGKEGIIVTSPLL